MENELILKITTFQNKSILIKKYFDIRNQLKLTHISK